EFVSYRQTNPLKGQDVAFRGFQDVDNSIAGQGPGEFIGSHNVALNTEQASGPNGYQPGFNAALGWRFANGATFSVDYTWISDHHTQAVATLAPPGLRVGTAFTESFITAPVFNFPNDFAGPAFDAVRIDNGTAASNPFATFGIWDAASTMTLQFTQRYDQVQA